MPWRDDTAGAERLTRLCGELAHMVLADDDVTEGVVNPQDGRLRLDTWSRGPVVTEEVIAPERLEMWLNVVATAHRVALGPAAPVLAAQLPDAAPYGGARLQAFIPPAAAGFGVVVRKRPTYTPTLDEYVTRGRMPPAYRDVLGRAVAERRTVVVCGGTGSGKTTLGRALLGELARRCPEDRVVILEDTPELACPLENHLALRTTPELSFAALLKATLRASPTRIVLGEVRDEAALDFLDASATGHPGGFCTVHAESALGALHRLDRLAQRANVPPQAALVGEAVGLVVVLSGGNQNRRVADLVCVDGFSTRSGYSLRRCTESGTWAPA